MSKNRTLKGLKANRKTIYLFANGEDDFKSYCGGGFISDPGRLMYVTEDVIYIYSNVVNDIKGKKNLTVQYTDNFRSVAFHSIPDIEKEVEISNFKTSKTISSGVLPDAILELMNEDGSNEILFVGDIVQVMRDYPPIGVEHDMYGIVVNTYQSKYEFDEINPRHGEMGRGVHVLFQNGSSCGFSAEEKEENLVLNHRNLLFRDYEFTNEIQLNVDFESGFFNDPLGLKSNSQEVPF